MLVIGAAVLTASSASARTDPVRPGQRVVQQQLPPPPLWKTLLPNQRGEPDFPVCPAPSVELMRLDTITLVNSWAIERQFEFTSPANIRTGRLIVYQGEGHSWDLGCNPGADNDANPLCEQLQPLEIARFELNYVHFLGEFTDHNPDDDVIYQYGFALPELKQNNVLKVSHIQRDIGGEGANSVFVKGVVCGDVAAPTATATTTATATATATRTATPRPAVTATTTATATSTPVVRPSSTPASTPTSTPATTPAASATPTTTPLPGASPTPTSTSAATPSPTPRVEPPTVVVLRYFTVQRAGDGVIVRWETSLERNTRHFDVMRAPIGPGGLSAETFAAAQVVNAQPIAASGSSMGAVYDYRDANAPQEQSAYWLVETELDGTRHVYGPAVLMTSSVYLPVLSR